MPRQRRRPRPSISPGPAYLPHPPRIDRHTRGQGKVGSKNQHMSGQGRGATLGLARTSPCTGCVLKERQTRPADSGGRFLATPRPVWCAQLTSVLCRPASGVCRTRDVASSGRPVCVSFSVVVVVLFSLCVLPPPGASCRTRGCLSWSCALSVSGSCPFGKFPLLLQCCATTSTGRADT